MSIPDFLFALLIRVSRPWIKWKKIKKLVEDYNHAPSASELATLLEEAEE